MHLEDKQAKGNASTALAELCSGTVIYGRYSDIKTNMDVLGVHKLAPTMNVCQYWCGVASVRDLIDNEFEAWAGRLCLLPPKSYAEVPPAVDGEFDIDKCAMHQFVFTEDDEVEAAAVEEKPKPELLAEQMEWEIAAAYDKTVNSFPEWYAETWASDPLASAVRADVPKALLMLNAWLKVAAESDPDRRGAIGPKALKVMDDMTTFAKAFKVLVFLQNTSVFSLLGFRSRSGKTSK